MPRRPEPLPLALQVGQRVKQLREEKGLTMEGLVFASELKSKGHLSNLERGLAVPGVRVLQQIADGLGVEMLDLLTFPGASERHDLINRSRSWKRGTIRKILKETEPGPESKPASPPAKKSSVAKKKPKRRRVTGRARAR